MQVERQRYVIEGASEDGPGVERKVGPPEKFEFGTPSDALSRAIGGAHYTSWNPDFLQRELGKEGTVARFFFEKKMAVDVGDPESKNAKKKRKLFFRHGFGYMCIPTNYSNAFENIRALYLAAIEEYNQYEKVHPRPAQLQETVIIDSDGRARRATITAIDFRVGGQMVGNVEQQMKELEKATKLSKREVRELKLHAKMTRKLRRSIQDGTPFRNPFIAKGKRLYPLVYST